MSKHKYGIEYTGYIEIDADNEEQLEEIWRNTSNEELGKLIHNHEIIIEDGEELY